MKCPTSIVALLLVRLLEENTIFLFFILSELTLNNLFILFLFLFLSFPPLSLFCAASNAGTPLLSPLGMQAQAIY